MNRLKLLALLFLLPLVLAAVGAWELHRVRTQMPAYATSDPVAQARVQAEIDELRDMQQRVMQDMRVTVRVGDKVYAYAAAHALLQRGIDRLSGNRWAYQRLGPQVIASFAWLAIAGGVGAVLLTGGGLLWASQAGRLARRSRDGLVRAFAVSRRLLPWLLIGAVLLTVLALIGVTGAEGWRIVDQIASGDRPRGEMRLYVIALVVGGMAIWAGGYALYNLRSAFSAFEIEPMHQLGRAVTRAEAPGLWRHVEAIAASVRARPPQNIVVGLVDGYYATAQSMVLQPEGRTLSGETLYVPLTHAALMRPDELSAIVGHELGHFSGEDTTYTMRFVPMFFGMLRSLDLIAEQAAWTVKPAYLMGTLLMSELHEAERHWSREREFAADAVGMHVAGGRASATALVRSQAVAPAVDRFFGEVLDKPDTAPADLVEALVAHVVRHGLPAELIDLDNALPHPTDTHPPTVQRLKALGQQADEALLAEATQAVDRRGLDMLNGFFAEPQAITAQLSRDLTGASIEHRQAVHADLVDMAAEAEPASELHEKVWPSLVVMLALAVLALGGAAFLAVRQVPPQGETIRWAVVAGALALAALFGWLSLRFHHRGRTAVLHLTPDGFGAPGMEGQVPWSAVTQVHMTSGQGCAIRFSLDPTVAAPTLRHRNLRRIAYQRKHHLVLVALVRIAGESPQDLLDRLGRYRRADYARRALADF